MKLIIDANLITLNKSKVLFSLLTNQQLANNTVSPYYSSIGSHLRHIIDFYSCIIRGLKSSRTINLIHRERDERMHHDCEYADCVLHQLISDFDLFYDYKETHLVKVVDNLGNGNVEIDYTLCALLAQANSHAIHHYAIINYIFDRLGIVIEDETFGYNPTTPRTVIQD